jgi:hypothetical protein
MNAKQRRAHVTAWAIVLIVVLAALGAVLVLRQRVFEAIGAG